MIIRYAKEVQEGGRRLADVAVDRGVCSLRRTSAIEGPWSPIADHSPSMDQTIRTGRGTPAIV